MITRAPVEEGFQAEKIKKKAALPVSEVSQKNAMCIDPVKILI